MWQVMIMITVYDRIDAAATITQFGAVTIRERRLLESGISFGAGTLQAEKNSVKK